MLVIELVHAWASVGLELMQDRFKVPIATYQYSNIPVLRTYDYYVFYNGTLQK
jgi:hypothetical protein